MKIKKIYIERYGPISNLTLGIGDGLQVIWGRNEAGKTLAIEAVIKILLQGKVRDFDDINRVEEEPEGYIIMEDDSKNDIKITREKGLGEYMDLRGMDLRNVFIIRDSDLTLKDHCGYFKDITDKLTGLQLDRLSKILSQFKEYGRLTGPRSDAALSDNKEFGKVLNSKKSAVSYIKDAGDYFEEARANKSDHWELDLIRLKQGLVQAKEGIRVQEAASNRDNYLKLHETFSSLKESWGTYIKVKDFSQEQYNKLVNLKAEIELKNKEKNNLGSKLDRILRDREEQEGRLTEVLSGLGPLESRRSGIGRLKEEIEIYNRRRSEEVNEANENIYKMIMFVFLFFVPAGFALAYFTLGTIIWPFVFAGVSLVMFIVFFLLLQRSGGSRSRFRKNEFMIINESKKIGIKARSFSEIMAGVNRFEDEYQAGCGKRESLNEKLRLLELREKETNQRMRLLEGELIDDGRKVNDIYRQYEIKDDEEFSRNLKLKNRLDSEIHTNAGILLRDQYIMAGIKSGQEQAFDGREQLLDNMEENISRWSIALESLKPEDIGEPEAQNKFKKQKYEKLLGERDRLEIEIEEKSGSLKGHEDNLSEFERRFSEIGIGSFMDSHSPIDINTLERLTESVEAVKEFIGKIDHEFEVAVRSIKLFEEIRDEEEAKISDLFKKLKVSRHFKEITSGRYTLVEFDPENRSVIVTDKNGRILDASKLSKGAYDQLFFAIRIALSEEIFDGGKGFFIMDDAFLASDEYRLNKQFKMLKKLAAEGWSILYFSVKSEIKELLPKYSDNRLITI